MKFLKRLHLLDLPLDSPIDATTKFKRFLNNYFPPLRNSDGSWKRSCATGHGKLDERLAAILGKQQVCSVVFMDVGVANGISNLKNHPLP